MTKSESGKPKPDALRFRIHGMDCSEEVAALKRELAPLVGGEERLSFDVVNGRMTVSGDPAGVSPGDIVQAVARAGLRAEPWRDEPIPAKGGPAAKRSRHFSLVAASGLAVLAGFIAHVWIAGNVAAALGGDGLGVAQTVPVLSRALYALAILAGGWRIFPRAWLAAKRFRPDMNLLMTIAVAGAVGIGEWFEAATVSFLFAVSLALESWSVGRARRAVAALMDLSPPTARLLRPDGTEAEVPPSEVAVGSRFLVKPGERIPLDGRVMRGASEVNQASITGESVPAPKAPGDAVFAGTICGDGVLEVECTKLAGDTTLAHIIRMVAESHSRRSPAEQWVEKFARIYTPTVLALALLALVVPPLLLGGDWREWLYRSLVFLVIGCPCALVISTPVSIVAALAAAARNGVLVKGGLYLELSARLRAIAVDKTGTLTEGRPAVAAVIPLSGHSEAELVERAAALEARSEHPLAKAIVAFATERGIRPRPADDFQSSQGKGASGQVNGRPYWLGSHRYLEERGEETPEVHRMLEEMAHGGRTVVVVGNGKHVCGFLALADAVRPAARGVLDELRRLGIEHVAMLTGDNKGTAQVIAEATGVDLVYAELLPADKVAVVERLVADYGTVAMVGDGVNDAPAMARATLGIAMGAAGSDAAVEAADIALMSDDLSKLPWLIRHARRTLSVIRQNIAFSLLVKALFVLLTLFGHASLWSAIAADMGASLLVIFNALRLLRPAS